MVSLEGPCSRKPPYFKCKHFDIYLKGRTSFWFSLLQFHPTNRDSDITGSFDWKKGFSLNITCIHLGTTIPGQGCGVGMNNSGCFWTI